MDKYLRVVADALQPKRTVSAHLIDMAPDNGKTPTGAALGLLKLLPQLLSANPLINGVHTTLQHEGEDAVALRELYSSILEQVLSLAHQSNDQTEHDQTERMTFCFS